MFELTSQRYITKGVREKVPVLIQIYCWQLIDRLKCKQQIELDYLQIFEFSRDTKRNLFIITHRQEEPFYQKTYEAPIFQSTMDFTEERLWVIDSGKQTMLLPEEY